LLYPLCFLSGQFESKFHLGDRLDVGPGEDKEGCLPKMSWQKLELMGILPDYFLAIPKEPNTSPSGGRRLPSACGLG